MTKGSVPAIEIKDLDVYYDDKLVLEDVNMTLAEGAFLGIIGPNGGGKTTLIKTILGLKSTRQGRIRLFGKPIDHTEKIIGYVPQGIEIDKHFPITVFETVRLSFLPSHHHAFFRFPRDVRARTMRILEMLNLSDLKDNLLSELSGGQFQKVLIARALATDPRILLLDEPTAHVDQRSREEIYALLKDLKDELTIILVTHDSLAVSSYISSLACLDRTLIYHGDPELDQKTLEKLYRCPIDLLAHGKVPHRVLKEHEEGDSR
ncbi:MAG: metal ABC transporter ATP-binding protein [Acholeplasmataceae bacterium]